jgi:hypothetical protein
MLVDEMAYLVQQEGNRDECHRQEGEKRACPTYAKFGIHGL